ncbi:TIGR03085 family metal-binding protein [Nocardioides ferulae]|uniref:TIGR03085 family metal-binding protein n=1 Tax=Nocardioides ferulae TaxID=2340821 RepID=UPI000EAF4458|nr:TIGR03085 family metal-binding protein [Nocardioides ferulae]
MDTPSLARRERHDLCDLALVVGEDAPTLCEGWQAKELICHLLVRETRPLGAAGLVVPGLARLTDRSMARMARHEYAVLVERLRDPGLTPYALPPVERLANTAEFFVHHEDLRRGQSGWEPRTLDAADERRLWAIARMMGRMQVRRAGVAVRIVDPGGPGRPGSAADLGGKGERVTVAGAPSELVLFLFGRDQLHGLEFEGSEGAVATLKGASLGF